MLVNTAYRYANVIPVCHSGTVFISSFLNVKSSGFLQQACGTQSSECEYKVQPFLYAQHATQHGIRKPIFETRVLPFVLDRNHSGSTISLSLARVITKQIKTRAYA